MASLVNPADDAAQLSAEALQFDGTEESAGRRRVLDAAAALFVAQGYAATTLRQIAAAAGIKAGSIYHHFDSKETIFVTVLADGMTVMRDAFETVHARTAGFDDAADRLRAHVRAHLGAVFEHGPYTTAHVTAFFTAPDSVRTAAVVDRDAYEHQWQVLLDDLLPDLAADQRQLHRLLLFGAMNTTVEWFDAAGSVTLDALAEAITDQFLNGVGP